MAKWTDVVDPVGEELPGLLDEALAALAEAPHSAARKALSEELRQLRRLDLRSAHRVEAERYEPLLLLAAELGAVRAEASRSSWSTAISDDRARMLLALLNQEDDHDFG